MIRRVRRYYRRRAGQLPLWYPIREDLVVVIAFGIPLIMLIFHLYASGDSYAIDNLWAWQQ